MKMDKFRLAKYSPENLERIKKVLKIISDDLELQEINRLSGNKIPLKRFENELLSYAEVVEILKMVQKEFGLFKIENLEIERMIKPPSYIYEPAYSFAEKENKKELLKTLDLTEDDLKNNLIIRANSLDIVERLKELTKKNDVQPEATYENNGIKGQESTRLFAFKLVLRGDLLLIRGAETKGKDYRLTKVTKASAILIEPLLKVCKNKPDKFKVISKDDISSRFSMGDSELEKATSNIPQFKKYLSGIGFKGELKGLFYANSPGGLGFKFRIAVPQGEWNTMTDSRKQKVVKMISGLSVQD